MERKLRQGPNGTKYWAEYRTIAGPRSHVRDWIDSFSSFKESERGKNAPLLFTPRIPHVGDLTASLPWWVVGSDPAILNHQVYKSPLSTGLYALLRKTMPQKCQSRAYQISIHCYTCPHSPQYSADLAKMVALLFWQRVSAVRPGEASFEACEAAVHREACKSTHDGVEREGKKCVAVDTELPFVTEEVFRSLLLDSVRDMPWFEEVLCEMFSVDEWAKNVQSRMAAMVDAFWAEQDGKGPHIRKIKKSKHFPYKRPHLSPLLFITPTVVTTLEAMWPRFVPFAPVAESSIPLRDEAASEALADLLLPHEQTHAAACRVFHATAGFIQRLRHLDSADDINISRALSFVVGEIDPQSCSMLSHLELLVHTGRINKDIRVHFVRAVANLSPVAFFFYGVMLVALRSCAKAPTIGTRVPRFGEKEPPKNKILVCSVCYNVYSDNKRVCKSGSKKNTAFLAAADVHPLFCVSSGLFFCPCCSPSYMRHSAWDELLSRRTSDELLLPRINKRDELGLYSPPLVHIDAGAAICHSMQLEIASKAVTSRVTAYRVCRMCDQLTLYTPATCGWSLQGDPLCYWCKMGSDKEQMKMAKRLAVYDVGCTYRCCGRNLRTDIPLSYFFLYAHGYILCRKHNDKSITRKADALFAKHPDDKDAFFEGMHTEVEDMLDRKNEAAKRKAKREHKAHALQQYSKSR